MTASTGHREATYLAYRCKQNSTEGLRPCHFDGPLSDSSRSPSSLASRSCGRWSGGSPVPADRTFADAFQRRARLAVRPRETTLKRRVGKLWNVRATTLALSKGGVMA